MTAPTFVDLVTLCGVNGDLDLFARNADGVHVPITTLTRVWPQTPRYAEGFSEPHRSALPREGSRCCA
jgi:hypothetical protein